MRPEVFAKVNSAQFPSCLESGEFWRYTPLSWNKARGQAKERVAEGGNSQTLGSLSNDDGDLNENGKKINRF